MKFAVIGDLHGSVVYLRFLMRKIRKTDALFITGDIAGTISYRLILKSILQNRKISREKYTESVYGRYFSHFIKFQKKTIKKIFKILSKMNIPVFFTHGNSDTKEMLELYKEFSRKNSLLHYLGNSIVKYEKLLVLGYGYCSPAEYRIPFQTPGEKNKDEILEDLSLLESQILEYNRNDYDLIIGLFHEPPKNTKLDFIEWKSTHSGSELVKEHIQKIPYNLIFAGHIHESQNYDIQEDKILVNPGSLVNRKWALVDTGKRAVFLKKIHIILTIKGFIYRTREIFK